MTLDQAKKAARAEAQARRDAAFASDPRAGERLAANVMAKADALGLAPGVAVSVYWPMQQEMDVRPLLDALAARGLVVALPVVMGKGKPLVFRRWRPGLVLKSGSFGVTRQIELWKLDSVGYTGTWLDEGRAVTGFLRGRPVESRRGAAAT